MNDWVDPTPIYTRLMAERESTPIYDRILEEREKSFREKTYRILSSFYGAEILRALEKGEELMENLQDDVNEFLAEKQIEPAPIPQTLDEKTAMREMEAIRVQFWRMSRSYLEQNLVESYKETLEMIYGLVGVLSISGFDLNAGFRVLHESKMLGNPEPNLTFILNETFRNGMEQDAVYNSEDVPLTMDVGGEIVGRAHVEMDHNGNLRVEGVLDDVHFLPQLQGISFLSTYDPPILFDEEPPERPAAENQEMP